MQILGFLLMVPGISEFAVATAPVEVCNIWILFCHFLNSLDEKYFLKLFQSACWETICLCYCVYLF